MMKTLKLLTVIFLTTLLLSCSKNKEDEELYMEITPQYPMKTLLENGVMELKGTKVNSPNTFELGYEFKTFKNGKITAFNVRIPDSEEIRVTLWDAETEEIIYTEYVQTTADLISTIEINPINIISGKNYVISLNTNDYYAFNDNGNQIFPTETNDVFILNYRVKTSTIQQFPSFSSESSYLGVVDIKFVPNN